MRETEKDLEKIYRQVIFYLFQDGLVKQESSIHLRAFKIGPSLPPSFSLFLKQISDIIFLPFFTSEMSVTRPLYHAAKQNVCP